MLCFGGLRAGGNSTFIVFAVKLSVIRLTQCPFIFSLFVIWTLCFSMLTKLTITIWLWWFFKLSSCFATVNAHFRRLWDSLHMLSTVLRLTPCPFTVSLFGIQTLCMWICGLLNWAHVVLNLYSRRQNWQEIFKIIPFSDVIYLIRLMS